MTFAFLMAVVDGRQYFYAQVLTIGSGHGLKDCMHHPHYAATRVATAMLAVLKILLIPNVTLLKCGKWVQESSA